MESLTHFELGITDQALHLATSAEHRETVLAMAQQARRSVHIVSRDLDPAVYDDSALSDALTQLARRSAQARIQILVQDTSRVVARGHALVRLAQQFSSRVEIRIPDQEYRDFNEAFFVADAVGYIRRPVADLYEAEGNFKAPFECRKLLQLFETVWERATPDPQLRRLHL